MNDKPRAKSKLVVAGGRIGTLAGKRAKRSLPLPTTTVLRSATSKIGKDRS